MGNTSGAKYKHMMYNVNWVRGKSGDKLKNSIEWYINLLKKEKVQGETKRIANTKKRAEARLKKFGVKKHMVVQALERKGLTDLVPNIA